MLWAAVGLAAITVPLFRGHLSRLANLRFRRVWLLLLAFTVETAIFKVWPDNPGLVHQGLHLVVYGLAAAFWWANRRIPGMWLMGLGGALNLVAIAANGGVMPGAPGAMAAAKLAAAPAQFVNSRVLEHPNLLFLGDVFAIPGWLPLHNVFSIGDVCLVLGVFLGLHRLCGSALFPEASGQFAALTSNRNFMRLWGAQAISNQGDWIYSLGVVAWLATENTSPAVLATLLAMQAAPRALASALGGPLVDRLSRRRLMVATDLVRAGAVLTLFLAPTPTLPHLYCVAACLGVCAALFQPSLHASVPNVVADDQLVAANAMVSMTFQMAIMVGPLAGAALFAKFGLGPALLINTGSFLLSGLLVAGVRIPARSPSATRSSPTRELLEGARFAARTPIVRGIFVVTGLVMFAAAIRNPLESLFLTRVLDVGPAALGLPAAVWGLGMLLGSSAAPTAARGWHRQRLLTYSIAIVGVAVLAASQVQALSSLLGLWLLAGSGNAVGTIAYQSLLQEHTPDALRGRIMAASEAVLDGAYLAGVTLAGWLGTAVGLRPALAVAGGVFLSAAVASKLLLGRTREEPAPAPLAAPATWQRSDRTVRRRPVPRPVHDPPPPAHRQRVSLLASSISADIAADAERIVGQASAALDRIRDALPVTS